MAANTPVDNTANSANHKRSTSASRSRGQSPPPRPTTPLRPPSRNSLRSSYTPTHGASSVLENPLAPLEAPFGELADSMADLEANFVHLQLMHESLARFSECFASFLYGLNVNAFCVDFPEAPIPESFRRAADNPKFSQPTALGIADAGNPFARSGASDSNIDPDQTFLTTDTSFVENPPASSVRTQSSRFSTPGKRGAASTATAGTRGARGGATAGRGTQGTRGRASGLARATGRGRGALGR